MARPLYFYVAGTVGAVCAYLFVSLAFTGTLHFLRLATFVAVFLPVFVGFRSFIDWAVDLEE